MLSGKLTNECVPIILSPAPISYIISTAAESKAIIFSGDFLNITFFSLESVIINGYDVGGIVFVFLEFVIFFVASFGCVGSINLNLFVSLLDWGWMGIKTGFVL